MRKKSEVFLILTNSLNESVLKLHKEINRAVEDDGGCFILFHLGDESSGPDTELPFVYPFSYESLVELNYTALYEDLVPGSTHFPLLQFYRDHPGFDHYWFIEDDVRFTGDWTTLFDDFAEDGSDFISAHLRQQKDEPAWGWWNAIFHPQIDVPIESRVRSFNPIFRISNAALRFIHSCLCNGWCGHQEVIIPTLLSTNDFPISDFGGEGLFVRDGLQNKFYTSRGPNPKGALDVGTMRYRPVFREPGTEQNKIYHPVKQL